MKPLRITLVQSTLAWQDPAANMAHFDKTFARLREPTDLIVLPEMFTTGFTMHPEQLAEPHEGPGLQWMLRKATEKQCVITGSIAVSENGNYYNRLYWVMPDGRYQSYNKRHLFRMAHEDQHYTPGNERIVVELNGWKICPLVCYDLRFPVWSRNTKTQSYDVLIYVANWPEVRSYPWRQLMIARAIENQCYVVGVNRVGADGHNIPHDGHSAVINPRGELLKTFAPYEEAIATVSLDMDYLTEFRKVFPVMLDADAFRLE